MVRRLWLQQLPLRHPHNHGWRRPRATMPRRRLRGLVPPSSSKKSWLRVVEQRPGEAA